MLGMTPQTPMDTGAPITDEQHAELTALLNKVKEKSATISSSNFVLSNEAEQRKRDALKEIFMQLAAEGVDLNDPASVSAFTQKLQQSNPDLYELFVEAVDQLMNDNQNGQAEEPVQPELPGVPEDLRERPSEAIQPA